MFDSIAPLHETAIPSLAFARPAGIACLEAAALELNPAAF